MVFSIASRLPRPRPALALNVMIGVLVVLDLIVGLSVVNQRAAADAAEPLISGLPVTRAAVASPAADPPHTSGEVSKVDRVVFEELQSSLLVARAIEVQNNVPVTALELSAALSGLVFVNGLADVSEGIIGLSSTEEGLLLLTRSGSGAWVCAASDAGISVLGASPERSDVSSVAGCGANPR